MSEFRKTEPLINLLPAAVLLHLSIKNEKEKKKYQYYILYKQSMEVTMTLKKCAPMTRLAVQLGGFQLQNHS